MESSLKMIVILFMIQIIKSTENLNPKPRKSNPILPTEPSLTQDELCVNKDNQFDSFKVEVAFKYGKYVCLMGQLWKKSDPGKKIRSVIRVIYWAERDQSGRTPYLYFDARVWKEIDSLNQLFKYKYAFTTDNMDSLFDDQKNTEVVYMIEEENKTTAFQFDLNKIESSEEPTFVWETDTKLVYDLYFDDWDRSQYLSLKFLIMHFPYPEIKIKSIMIFDRSYYSKQYKHSISTSYEHLAIVYTEEVFQGKTYYFRHYMRSEKRDYTDFRGHEFTFSRLDWYFDENVEYCTKLEQSVDTVVFLRKEEVWINFKSEITIYFAEFYGLKHKLLKITFNGTTDRYTLEDEDGGQLLDNADSLLSCKPRPDLVTRSEPFTCKDYPNDERQDFNIIEELFESQDSGREVSLTFFIFSAVLVIAILVTICASIYLVVNPFKQKEFQT